MKKLTARQQQIYDYILAFTAENGYPPSVREIGQALELSSPSTVHFHLKRLQEHGLIEKGDFKGRAIVLTEPREKDRIPILGSVAAGAPILAQECIEDYLTFDCAGLMPWSISASTWSSTPRAVASSWAAARV